MGGARCLCVVVLTVCLLTVSAGPVFGRSTRRDGKLVAQPEPIVFENAKDQERQALCPESCSGHGVCNVIAFSSFPPSCTCLYMWTGETCGVARCVNNCSGSGSCNTTTGECVCNPGLGGVDCTTVLPRPTRCPLDCSSHGVCVGGFCRCALGYTGSGCELETCPGNCSNHGLCWDTGMGQHACACEEGYAGERCEFVARQCPVAGCSGHGSCSSVTGACTCERGWKGPGCEMRECISGYLNNNAPHPPPGGDCPNDCSCNGHCWCSESGDCHCMCAPSWAGDDCSVTVHP